MQYYADLPAWAVKLKVCQFVPTLQKTRQIDEELTSGSIRSRDHFPQSEHVCCSSHPTRRNTLEACQLGREAASGERAWRNTFMTKHGDNNLSLICSEEGRREGKRRPHISRLAGAPSSLEQRPSVSQCLEVITRQTNVNAAKCELRDSSHDS